MTIPEMLAVLFSYGMSQTAIAEKVGVSQPTIYRASKGASLSYRAGKKVEKLYLEMERKYYRSPHSHAADAGVGV